MQCPQSKVVSTNLKKFEYGDMQSANQLKHLQRFPEPQNGLSVGSLGYTIKGKTDLTVVQKTIIDTKGITVHKIHSSVDTTQWLSQFGTFSIRGGNWLRRNVGNISVLNHEDIYHTSTRLYQVGLKYFTLCNESI